MNYVKEKGFTLIELIMTIAIMGMLASVVLPMAEITVQHKKEQDLRVALREIRDALDAYKKAVDEGRVARIAGSSGYPESLQILVDGVNDLKNPASNARIYFLRRIPRDPMEKDQTRSDAESWGKRSYESSADEPQEGSDVYDVYSLSSDSGLNGVPYNKW
ncbi:MAG: type II secretion system protein [Nitrosomonadales bacterium]|nr:type II secretion system protein [Nitrosomonadales bacterium]